MQKIGEGDVLIIQHPDSVPEHPPYAQEFFAAIGRFAVAWGAMETHLEALLQLAINIEGRGDPERLFQINLGRKIDQLKDICRDCPKLKSLEEDVRRLSPVLKEWGQDRDFLIHSILIGFSDGPPQKIILRHVEHPKGTLMVVERGEFTLDAIQAFTEQVRSLHRAIIPLIERATEMQDPQKLEKARALAQEADPKRPPIPL
jgi:hypothetical protein